MTNEKSVIDLTTVLTKNQLKQRPNPKRYDATPLKAFDTITIEESGDLTIYYNENVVFKYNTTHRSTTEKTIAWLDDGLLTNIITNLIDAIKARLHQTPETLECPTGCAECCKGLQAYVTQEDAERIAEHMKISTFAFIAAYVNVRESPDGSSIGWLRQDNKDENGNSQCNLLLGTKSGQHACSVYDVKPVGCTAYDPIGCDQVDEKLFERTLKELETDKEVLETLYAH